MSPRPIALLLTLCLVGPQAAGASRCPSTTPPVAPWSNVQALSLEAIVSPRHALLAVPGKILLSRRKFWQMLWGAGTSLSFYLYQDNIKPVDSLTPRQISIIGEEVDFLIQLEAPQLQPHRERLVQFTRVLLHPKQDRFDWLSRLGAVVYLTSSLFVLARDVGRARHKRMTRQQFVKTFKQFFYLFITGVLLLLVFDANKKPSNVDLFAGLHESDAIATPGMDEPGFRFVVVHKLIHLFGESGLGIVSRDTLFADTRATLRVLQTGGELALEEMYRQIADTPPLGTYFSYPRASVFREAGRLMAITDPNQRELAVQRFSLSTSPGYQFIDAPMADRAMPWIIRYATATAAVINEFIKQHSREDDPDFSLAWRYLSLREQGITPSEAERRALQGERRTERRSADQIVTKLRPSLTPVLRISGYMALAVLGGLLLAAETTKLAQKIRQRPLPDMVKSTLKYMMVFGSLALATSSLAGHVWWWRLQDAFEGALLFGLGYAFYAWTQTPTQKNEKPVPHVRAMFKRWGTHQARGQKGPAALHSQA